MLAGRVKAEIGASAMAKASRRAAGSVVAAVSSAGGGHLQEAKQVGAATVPAMHEDDVWARAQCPARELEPFMAQVRVHGVVPHG